jgi:hypothetical protein
MVKLSCRVMDTDNGGIVWGDPISVEIEPATEGTSDEMALENARRINKATWLATGGLEDEEAPGEVVRAAGTEYAGICWIDDLGHQGATQIIVEWHSA